MNPRLAALMSIIAQSIHFRANPKSTRRIEPRPPKQWDRRGAGSGKRQGARIQRQIDKGMLSVGSSGFRAPMTRKQAGL